MCRISARRLSKQGAITMILPYGCKSMISDQDQNTKTGKASRCTRATPKNSGPRKRKLYRKKRLRARWGNNDESITQKDKPHPSHGDEGEKDNISPRGTQSHSGSESDDKFVHAGEKKATVTDETTKWNRPNRPYGKSAKSKSARQDDGGRNSRPCQKSAKPKAPRTRNPPICRRPKKERKGPILAPLKKHL